MTQNTEFFEIVSKSKWIDKHMKVNYKALIKPRAVKINKENERHVERFQKQTKRSYLRPTWRDFIPETKIYIIAINYHICSEKEV